MFDILTRHGASAAGDYEIERSVRHNSGDTTYFDRTPSSTTNRTTFTFSVWVKFTTPGITSSTPTGAIFGVWQDNTSRDVLRFESGKINLQCGQHSENVYTDALFRDPSAWYHIVCAVDSTQASSGNRVAIYVNGVLQSLSQNTISQNREFKINTDNKHVIGARWLSDAYHIGFNGYIAEFHFIDGTKVAASSFGETNADTGQWIPKKYAGSYGTNGYYLDFSDNSGTSATTLGKDSSGNGNNFTPNNYSVSSGAGNDSVTDTPTNNYATLNPLAVNMGDTSNATVSNGGLDWVGTYNNDNIIGTMSVSSGKWYYELVVGSNADKLVAGWTTTDETVKYDESALIYYNSIGIRQGNRTISWNSDVTTSLTFATNDVIGFALNLTDNELKVYENNSLVSTITVPTDKGDTWIPAMGDSSSTDAAFTVNFGQQGFTHTPPTGFKALCTQNLPEPTIKNPSKYFNTGLYTGTGSSNAITGLGFQPDKVVVKMRNSTSSQDFQIFDDVRGANKVLRWNNQETSDTQTTRFTSFDSDGFTVGTENITNQSSKLFVYWAWKESATAGFDMVKYTGNGSSPRTVSHSLGVVPELYIIKNMETNDTRWIVGNKTMDADENMFINSTDDDENVLNAWASTRPTSSVFTVADDNEVNKNGEEHIAYLWASVEGMCKVGTYTGNFEHEGSFLHMGFRPSFILIKNTNDNAAWMLYDDARGVNPDNPYLCPSGYNSMIELNDIDLDIVSNGIKFRHGHNNTNAVENTSAYIYLAMARSPFKYANAR